MPESPVGRLDRSISNSAISNSDYPSAITAWYATGVLALLYWISILDRFIISLLVDPIRRDLEISDTQFGLLNGAAFGITFAAFGLVAGAITDRSNRRWIVFACVSIWSLATMACGLAQNFWHMLLARMGVGLGEAGLNPSATSMISDMFPRDRITAALAVYSIGASLGSGCAYLLGGVLVYLVAEAPRLVLPIIGELRPWQATFGIVGIPGLICGLLIFTVKEPARRGVGAGFHGSPTRGFLGDTYHHLFKFMLLHPRFFISHYLGFSVAGIIIAGGAAWYPAHMARTFGWSAATIGLIFGITLVVAGISSKLICGLIVDRMYRHGLKDAQMRWYAGCMIAAGPIVIFAVMSSDPVVFVALIALFVVLTSPMPACASAALSLVTPNELRGSGMAIFMTINALLGAALGPVLVAAISEFLFFEGEIGNGIAAVAAIACPASALILWRGFAPMSEAVLSAERQ